MKRFIRYLYEYENGKKVRNVGFVKVEQEEAACTMNIYGKGLHLESHKNIELYVFYKRNDTCVGIHQARIENVNPTINYRLKFNAEDVGGLEKFGQIQGVILSNFSKPKYASVWDDGPIDLENMAVEKVENKEIESGAEKGKPVAVEDSVRQPEPAEAAIEEPTPVEIPEPVQMKAASSNVSAGRAADAVRSSAAAVVESAEETAAECTCAESTPQSGKKYTKIKREEMAGLPRRDWYLANNSFLLHGYGNYHHLMIIEEDKNLWLGVPGVYHEKEKAAAEAFGFSQFIEIEEDLGLEEDECEVEKFGYWSRQVSHYQV